MQKSTWFVFGGILMMSSAWATPPGETSLAHCQWKLGADATEPSAITPCPELKDLIVPITPRDGVPKILSWTKAPTGEHLWLLKYAATSKGPRGPYRMERLVVVDVASKSVVGDALYRFVPAAGKAPKWVWSRTGVRVDNLPPGEEPLDYKFGTQSPK